MTGAIVGREFELARVREFVADVAGGGTALVLEGEAGAGKTTLWTAGVEEAVERGLRVLGAQPGESETALSFSGVGDLLDPVLDEALGPLPGPQRRALSRALVLDEHDGPSPDPRAIGVAVLGALRTLAAAAPSVVAVDDVQWLDAASSAALAYAARRLRDEPVGFLLSRRSQTDAPFVVELRRARADGFLAVQVGPLDADALHRVVQGHLTINLPRPLLAEVHETSGGNPFYALEIVRSLHRTGVLVEAGRPLPVPESLHDLVHGRLSDLPPDSRSYLLAAAALSQPTIELVESATGVSREAGLLPAIDARIVELDGSRIRFTHPLLAAGAYETVGASDRAQLHLRLAELVDDPEARARHLAASASEPNEEVAAALEEAAARAQARGAPRAAGLLLERSAELTIASDSLAAKRRRLGAAAAHHEAGDTDRARALLEPALEQAPPGPERAAALVALARVRSYDDDLRGALALFEQAVTEVEPGSLVEGIAQEGLAGMLFRLREGLARSVEASARAAEIGRAHDSMELVAEALATKATSEAALGRSDASETSEQAMALQSSCAHRPILRQPAFAVAVVQFWHDDLRGAHRSYEEMAALAVELGDESSMPYVRVMLGQIDCALGRFDEALREADEGQALAEQAGQRTLLGYVLAIRAVAEAHLGRVDDATASATRALELARETSGVPAWIFASWALGHLDLSRGDYAGALESLVPLLAHHRREEIREPGALPFAPDGIEALVAAGRLDEASEALDAYLSTAERLGRDRGLVAARRCRGLLLAANGDLPAAIHELETVIELSSLRDTPFEHARSLLALGVTQRRMKRRREARETLEGAYALFEGMGAELWAERARAELRRISGRAASAGALTPAEERVAALVAEGKTNREVAAALFLSERTVEGHLSHVFGKLGVRSRTELARKLSSRTTQVVAGSNPGDSPVSGSPSAL